MAIILQFRRKCKMTFEEKWALVKDFYEKQGRKSHGMQFRFQRVPSETEVEMLYKNMLTLQQAITEFYRNNPRLGQKLCTLSGQVFKSTTK